MLNRLLNFCVKLYKTCQIVKITVQMMRTTLQFK